MNDFLEKGWKVIKWAGDIIYRVVSWFIGGIREMVENAVKDFLKYAEKKLKQAIDFAKTLKVAVIKKMMSKLAEIANKLYKELSPNDKEIIDNLFETDPNCPI